MSSRSWLEKAPPLPFTQAKLHLTVVPDVASEPAFIPARSPDPEQFQQEVAYWQAGGRRRGGVHRQVRKGEVSGADPAIPQRAAQFQPRGQAQDPRGGVVGQG